jgi:chromosome segregation ATPase
MVCGHQWKAGEHGGHRCADRLSDTTIDDLRGELTVLAGEKEKLKRKNNILLDDLSNQKAHIKKLEAAPVKWRQEKAELIDDLAEEVNNRRALQDQLTNIENIKEEKAKLIEWLENCQSFRDDVMIRHVLKRIKGE